MCILNLTPVSVALDNVKMQYKYDYGNIMIMLLLYARRWENVGRCHAVLYLLFVEQVIPTKDRMEGIKAFNEKRPPQYKGE